MSDKIQKAREALSRLAPVRWEMTIGEINAALDEAEANAKRVAELERDPGHCKCCVDMDETLETERRESAAKDAEIERLRGALREAHRTADFIDDAPFPTEREARYFAQHIQKTVDAALAPATPEPAKCVNPRHGRFCSGNGAFCTKPPPAPEAAPDLEPQYRKMATDMEDGPARYIVRDLLAKVDDLRAQLAAAQALLPGPKSMVCTIAEWDRLWQERAAANARADKAERLVKQSDHIAWSLEDKLEAVVTERDAAIRRAESADLEVGYKMADLYHARRDLAEAVELLREAAGQEIRDNLHVDITVFLARLSAAQGDDNG